MFYFPGGTVYHDEGNMNFSFITDRSLYDRKCNLQLAVDALKSQWDLPLTINDRDDIIIFDKYKVSQYENKVSVCVYITPMIVYIRAFTITS